MSENSFKNILGSYVKDESVLRELEQGEVLVLDIYKGKGIAIAAVKFPSLINTQTLEKAQKSIEKSLNLKTMLIKPKYTPDMFDISYFQEIVAVLRRQASVVNGFFDDAKASFEDNKLTIELQNGGFDIIKRAGVDLKLLQIISDLFSFQPVLEFTGTLTVSQSQHEELIKSSAPPKPQYTPREDVRESPKQTYSRSQSNEDEPKKVSLSFTDLPFLSKNAVQVTGRKITERPAPLCDVTMESGRITAWGDVFAMDRRESRDGSKLILSYNVTDYTSSNTLKIIIDVKKSEPLEKISKGSTILFKGEVSYDKYDREITIRPSDIMLVEKKKKMDMAQRKRVELHVHTNMSSMDGITDAATLIKTAHRWGHKAIAITDHGVAQAFPEAMNTVDQIHKEDEDFKLIYGVEAYFVNDCISAVDGVKEQPIDGEFIVFDTETTGLNATYERLTEIGAVKIKNGQVVDTFNTFVNPQKPIPPKITELTGITDNMVKDAPLEAEALKSFIEFCGDSILIAHNAPFDMGFINATAKRNHIDVNYTSVDTVVIARSLYRNINNHKLNTLVKHLELGSFNHHRASDDAEILARIFFKMAQNLKEEYEVNNISEINTKLAGSDPKKLPAYHQILLVKNAVGLKN
ncbi:MAG: polymerase alpha subunit, partial [Oscillospiraceae bacterium]|nr:polymerase alpha subunit [Oscillospiraceae bacterium]